MEIKKKLQDKAHSGRWQNLVPYNGRPEVESKQTRKQSRSSEVPWEPQPLTWGGLRVMERCSLAKVRAAMDQTSREA